MGLMGGQIGLNSEIQRLVDMQTSGTGCGSSSQPKKGTRYNIITGEWE